MPMLVPIISGRNTTLMINALVRTAARYSRTAMTTILRMAVLHRFRPRDPDKNFLQGRVGQLEVEDPSPPDQGGQDFLGIGAPLQAQLLQPAEIRDLDDPRHIGQVRIAAVEPYPHRVAAVGLLDRLQ